MIIRKLASLGAGVLLAVAVVGCGSDGPDSSGDAATDAPSATSEESEAAVGTLDFTATEFAFDPATPVVEPGAYTGTVTNEGAIEHDIKFENGEDFLVQPGESVDIEFDVPEGGVAFLCTIPGHAEAGMTGRIETS